MTRAVEIKRAIICSGILYFPCLSLLPVLVRSSQNSVAVLWGIGAEYRLVEHDLK